MYAQDNGDLLPPNDYPFNSAEPQDGSLKCWVFGSMAINVDKFFPAELVNLKLSSLAGYNTNPAVYKCPADTLKQQGHDHARSVSMNCAVGTRWWTAGLGTGAPAPSSQHPPGSPVGGGWLSAPTYADPDPNYRTYGKISQMTRPGPSSTWVIMDENPYTINDPLMAIAMTPVIIDWPASYHGGSAGIAFADGHAELHKWVDALSAPIPPGVDPNSPNQFTVSPTPVTGPSRDLDWIQPYTTALQ